MYTLYVVLVKLSFNFRNKRSRDGQLMPGVGGYPGAGVATNGAIGEKILLLEIYAEAKFKPPLTIPEH